MALFLEGWKEPAVLRPVDEWDSRMQSEVEAEVLALMAAGRRSFIVDLDAVTHLQWRILPGLVGLSRQVRQLGGTLVLSAPSPYLLDILAAGDVPGEIPIYPSEASAAMGTFGASAASVLWQEGERERSGLGV